MRLNKDDIIKKLKNGEKVTVEVQTSDSSVMAHIVITPDNKGGAKLKGYPMNASPKYKLDTMHVQRTALSIHSIDLNIRDLAAVIESKYKYEHRPKAAREKKSSDHNISEKLKKLKDELMRPDNYIKYIPKVWAQSTTEAAVNYLLSSIAPAMDRYGDDIDEDDMLKIKAELIAHAANSGRGKKTKDGKRNPKSAETVESGLENRFRRAGVVYQWVLDHHPELGLPNVEFIKSQKDRKALREKTKALPDDVRVRFANLIVLLCGMGVSLAYGAALEFFCGLRVSEAAAPLIGELILITDNASCLYGKYFAAYQLDKHGKRTPYLKRPSSKRYVPLTSVMVQLVQMRIGQLRAAGYETEQILKIPLVSYRDAPEKFVGQAALAGFAKDLLKLAGCDAAYMEDAVKLMCQCPEYDEDGNTILDVTSHLCRRDFATRVKGHCSALDLDAILGHENLGNKGKDYGSNDTMRKLARELEICFTFNPELTQNPAFRPIQLAGNKDIHLIGNTAYRFENCTNQDMAVNLDLLNLEPNDPMIVHMSPGVQVKALQRRSPTDTPASRKGRRIRNRQLDCSSLEKWRAEAESIDISTLLKKYDH